MDAGLVELESGRTSPNINVAPSTSWTSSMFRNQYLCMKKSVVVESTPWANTGWRSDSHTLRPGAGRATPARRGRAPRTGAA